MIVLLAAALARGSPAQVEFSNVHKVMFPEPGYTKGDVLKFYLELAPWLLPHLHDRPVTLERLPDGVRQPRIART